MKYRVIWHDCEDERTGEDFQVEASNPSDAYFKVVIEIKSFSPYLRRNFSPIDIEYLVDERGKHHYPDLFLGGE